MSQLDDPHDEWDAWDMQIVADQERLGVNEVIRRLSGTRGDELSAAMIDALANAQGETYRVTRTGATVMLERVHNDALSRADVHPQPNKNSDSASA